MAFALSKLEALVPRLTPNLQTVCDSSHRNHHL